MTQSVVKLEYAYIRMIIFSNFNNESYHVKTS